LMEEFRGRILLFVTHDRGIASRVSQVLDLARLSRTSVISVQPHGGVTIDSPSKVKSGVE